MLFPLALTYFLLIFKVKAVNTFKWKVSRDIYLKLHKTQGDYQKALQKN